MSRSRRKAVWCRKQDPRLTQQFPCPWRFRGRARPWIFRLELPLRRPGSLRFLALVAWLFADLPWGMVALIAPMNPIRTLPTALAQSIGSETSCVPSIGVPENVVIGTVIIAEMELDDMGPRARRQMSAGAVFRRRNRRSANAADAKPGSPAAGRSGTS